MIWGGIFLAWNSYIIRKRGQQAGKEAPMKIQYRFAKLSRDQRELLEMVLLEEMDMQRWFTVAFSTAFGREVFLSLN
jgi:hypothetical protein